MTGDETDWARVEELGRALFADGFDDFLVAAYLARATQARAGLDGLALGLLLFTELLGPRSATATPPARRQRARKSALRWWTGATLELLRKAPVASSPPQEHEGLASALTALQELATTTLGADAPSLAAITRELRRITRAAPDTAKKAADGPEAPPLKTAEANPDPPPQESPSPIDGEHTLSPTPEERTASTDAATAPHPRELRRLGAQLIDASQRQRELDIRDPRAYELLRSGLWLHFDALPPMTEGKTAIPPRQASAWRHLDALSTRKAWEELIHTSERLLVRNRLDLDLQRTSATALESLDPPATQAAAIIRARTRELIARLPGLLTLCRSDESPLASADTRAWLRPDIAPRDRARRTVPTSPNAMAATTPPPTMPAADLQGQSATFLDRLNTAEAALEAGERHLAAALFVGLDSAAQRHHLDTWRPDLARRVLVGALASRPTEPEPEHPHVPSRWEQRLGVLCPDALADVLRMTDRIPK